MKRSRSDDCRHGCRMQIRESWRVFSHPSQKRGPDGAPPDSLAGRNYELWFGAGWDEKSQGFARELNAGGQRSENFAVGLYVDA